MRNKATFLGIFQPLLDRLTNVNLIHQIIPISIFRKVLEQMLNLFFEFGFFHTNYLINWFLLVLSQVDARKTTDKMNEIIQTGFILPVQSHHSS